MFISPGSPWRRDAARQDVRAGGWINWFKSNGCVCACVSSSTPTGGRLRSTLEDLGEMIRSKARNLWLGDPCSTRLMTTCYLTVPGKDTRTVKITCDGLYVCNRERNDRDFRTHNSGLLCPGNALDGIGHHLCHHPILHDLGRTFQ